MCGVANFTRQFQEEVRRLVRKETREDLERLRREASESRRALNTLKRQVEGLERAHRQARGGEGPQAAAKEAARKEAAPAVARVRITAQTVRALRQKLRLTQAEFGRLLGVSGQSVYQWERQEGRLQLRRATQEAIIAAKGMGVREARTRLGG